MAKRHANLSRDEEIVLVKEIGSDTGYCLGKWKGMDVEKSGKFERGDNKSSRCFKYVITVFS